jgi:hypothetical protein
MSLVKKNYTGISIVEAFRMQEFEVDELHNEIFDVGGFVSINPSIERIIIRARCIANFNDLIISECNRILGEPG